MKKDAGKEEEVNEIQIETNSVESEIKNNRQTNRLKIQTDMLTNREAYRYRKEIYPN